jgi:hypothetical protein
MEDQADEKLADLKERIASQDYAIDPRAVADAILRRSRDMALLRAEMRPTPPAPGPRGGPTGLTGGGSSCAQSRCSNPSSRLAASWKLTPGEPWMTRPIQVIRAFGSALAKAASSPGRALGAAQTHSS